MLLDRKTKQKIVEIQKDGRDYQIRYNQIIVNNRIAGFALIVIDITEKRRAERQRQEFTANVSHELKTPLQSIIGCAELIENGFDPFIDRTPDRVLDMCTGSGCIAIAIALHFDGDCEVDAVDISEEALEVAEINIRGYGLENCVFPIKSDLFSALPKGDKYDLIVANPPYVDAHDLSTMPKEFEAEPELALGSGEDGLDCARKILAQAVDYLSDDGVLIMEVGNSAENLNDAFPHVPFHFIDLKKGGGGVFLLTAEQLKAYADVFKAAL